MLVFVWLVICKNQPIYELAVFCLANYRVPQNHGISGYQNTINLVTAVGREKDVQDIDVHGEYEKLVATLLVMRGFSDFPVMRHSDASRARLERLLLVCIFS